MPIRVRLLALAMLAATPAAAQSALPPGYYTITGTATSVSGQSCPLPAVLPASGVLYYPGVGHDTTQLTLQSVELTKAITTAVLYAFPPVPADGLNGWTKAKPAGPDYTQYRNRKLTGGGTGALLSFNLGAPIGASEGIVLVLGSILLRVDSIAPCDETIEVSLQKVANFQQNPD